jgi:hypothetical protein
MTLEQLLTKAGDYLDGAMHATLQLNARLLDIDGADDELRADVLGFMSAKLAEDREAQLARIRAEFEAFERGDNADHPKGRTEAPQHEATTTRH